MTCPCIPVVAFAFALALWGAARGAAAEPAPQAAAPLCISGVYPHLAVQGGDECGIGTLVPWAGKLWFNTYGSGGGGVLYSVDERLNLQRQMTGVSGLGDRMIHRESEQLFIGSCAVNAQGEVRRVQGTKFRGTAAARHLSDPANKIYVYGMEGQLAEVDVHTLQGLPLCRVQQQGVTGAHGKGGYSGQGRLVVANNGGNGGGLAEWDGVAGHPWKLLEHKQFTDVTGPGGIYGAAQPTDPLWTIGWDRRSVLLKVCDQGQWLTYRLPKASYTHDSPSGWYTEWPRIREVAPGRYMLDHHGMFYDFPADFRPGHTAGLRPLATHLRMVVDWAHWNGRLVMSHDDASALGSGGLTTLSQSNLWFGPPDEVRSFGKPAGWGGPWVEDAVRAGEPSDPLLVAGFEKRVLHLAHDAPDAVTFTLEADAAGRGEWSAYQKIEVPARGYGYHIFPADFAAQWVRVKAGRDCQATAYFHFTSSGGPADGNLKADLFRALAPAGGDQPRTDGVLMHGKALALDFFARRYDARGAGEDLGHYVSGADLNLVPAASASGAKPQFASAGPPARGGKAAKDQAALELPRSAEPSPYQAAAAQGWTARVQRSVITERYLANIEGTLYEVPFSGGMQRARPIATHGRWISDLCCWRGMLVLAGARSDAEPDGHYVKSGDGRAGLWLGKLDDLWHLGKPRGVGGPWKNARVEAGKPSAPYMMTNFDRKTLDLSHDAPREVTFTVAVDFLATGSWRTYATLTVPPGKTVRHEFPDGYAAHWVRLTADTDCAATAFFTYE